MNRTMVAAALALLLPATLPTAALAAPTEDTGSVKIVVPAGRTLSVKVGTDKHKATAGNDTFTVKEGEHDLVVSAPGMIPTTGKIKVVAGKTLVVEPVVETIPDTVGQETHGWIAFGTGMSFILATIIVDQTVDFDDETTRDALEWSMAGVGSALTILGGVLLKDAYDSENPEPKATDYKTTVGVAPVEGGAMLSGGITF
jgi:hypothetical protein